MKLALPSFSVLLGTLAWSCATAVPAASTDKADASDATNAAFHEKDPMGVGSYPRRYDEKGQVTARTASAKEEDALPPSSSAPLSSGGGGGDFLRGSPGSPSTAQRRLCPATKWRTKLDLAFPSGSWYDTLDDVWIGLYRYGVGIYSSEWFDGMGPPQAISEFDDFDGCLDDPDKVVIRTRGEDALLIDQVFIQEDDWYWQTRSHWGQNHGVGYCVSKDMNDNFNSRMIAGHGCYGLIEFTPGGKWKGYPSGTFVRLFLEDWDWAKTDNTVTVKFKDSSGYTQETVTAFDAWTKWPGLYEDQDPSNNRFMVAYTKHGYLSRPESTWQNLDISIDGGDAAFVRKVVVENADVDSKYACVTSKQYQQYIAWDRSDENDGDTSWCLSTESGDKQATSGECESTLRLTKSSGNEVDPVLCYWLY